MQEIFAALFLNLQISDKEIIRISPKYIHEHNFMFKKKHLFSS